MFTCALDPNSRMTLCDQLYAALRAEIDAYIEESTGIQTIYQMKWLAEKAHALRPDAPADPWFYKEEYNRELMKTVALRREKAASRPRP